MTTSARLLFAVFSFFILISGACTHRIPDQQDVPGTLLSFRIINKTSDPVLAKLRDEAVVIDGQEIKIGESSAVNYTFDAQKRPVNSVFSAKGFSEYSGSTSFEYRVDKLILKNKYESQVTDEVTFPLNDRALLAEAKYNADGFAIEEGLNAYRTTNTIENGNIIRRETRDTTDQALFAAVVFEYDLSKPNLPNVAPYKGRQSQNLPIRQTIVKYNGSKANPQATTTIFEYRYTFDDLGRPIRRYSKLQGAVTQHEVVDYAYTYQP